VDRNYRIKETKARMQKGGITEGRKIEKEARGRERERAKPKPWLLCKRGDEQSSACKHQIKTSNAVSSGRVVAHEDNEQRSYNGRKRFA